MKTTMLITGIIIPAYFGLNEANGLVVFCATDDKFYAYIASANIWKEILFVP